MQEGITPIQVELETIRPASAGGVGRRHASGGRSIARESPIPYHHQLFEILRDAINSSVWRPGETIPSEFELATMYGISRTVIRSALRRLTQEGFVEQARGKRTVVLPPQFGFEAALGDSAWPHSIAGSAYPGRVIDSTLAPCDTAVATCLAIPAEREVFQLTCVHRGEGMPNSLTRIFLRADATPSLRDLALSGQMPEVEPSGPPLPIQLEMRYGLRLCRSEATVEAKACDEFEAGALDVQPGQPVFDVATVSYDLDGARQAYARIVFCTKRAAFNFTIRHRKRQVPLP